MVLAYQCMETWFFVISIVTWWGPWCYHGTNYVDPLSWYQVAYYYLLVFEVTFLRYVQDHDMWSIAFSLWCHGVLVMYKKSGLTNQNRSINPFRCPCHAYTVYPMICGVLLWFGTGQLYPYPSGLHHWYWGNHMIAPVPVKQPWRIWVNE